MTVGIGFRREIASHLLREPERVDVVEIIAERALKDRHQRREAIALTEIWPVIPHGTKLSLGSADGCDESHAKALGKLAKELRAPYVSEHVSFVRAAGVEIGHLTQLPRTRAAVAVIARNVIRVKKYFPCPLLLENVAWSVRWPDDEMDEAAFYNEIVEATGCRLLLDVGNLYANAKNEGLDPLTVLDGYPLESVEMMHVAGSTVADDGFVFDTHAHPVPSEVFALVNRVIERVGARPIILERDRGFGPFSELTRELDELRALQRATRSCAAPIRSSRTVAPRFEDLPAPVDQQIALARGLRDGVAPPGFSPVEIARARSILVRKWAEG